MRLFLLTSLTLLAFAANSVLNRIAVGGGIMAPLDFAVLRLAAGAGALWLLALLLSAPGGAGQRPGLMGAVSLLLYLVAFSLAYLGLSAGEGALILFATVQITMFLGAAIAGEALPPRRLAGAAIALAGLAGLIWPAGRAGGVSLTHAGLMALAGLGWGLYSLSGRRAGAPIAASARNFLLALPLGTGLWLALQGPAGLTEVPPAGLALAILSGAVTSGLGYALWYHILPELGAGRAAVVQLAVPVLAALMGLALLGEPLGLRLVLAGGIVLAGIALAVWPSRRGPSA